MKSKIEEQNLISDIFLCVARALAEDINDGDITALLIPEDKIAEAEVISRDAAVVCGKLWVEETFKQLDPNCEINWYANDGDDILPGDKLFQIKGLARAILTGERTALNFLQTLSGTATVSREYSMLAINKGLTILDTRKTIPGLRLAQKYAVKVGGCSNHRIGLYDAFLIKENHILACGSIEEAVTKAREIAPEKTIEVEAENLLELTQALAAKVDIIMLDNFSDEDLSALSNIDLMGTKIEASGNLNQSSIAKYINSNIDYVSSGSITKNLKAIDLSMRFIKV
ncbi:carboxylating nicotinate-nucleotide diphosphorylase [Colwellia sp. 6M3]|jgi:nicotinate-nucleotide pyrophosphorylase (carboxylating)|uniref:carboxylating nicotinate-nucleotide diphosphorylase n=1 Tax=Colwellia sp. 6M3 TaxID=2759849 RepID=UPI0015F747A7|nr:carboxylating nicotinate-nucleotide diphosphorylase [Colwellia sp. 6M3]MBA6416988.1 carboxylating nicotinate-nucleotide diphosphorylase [Colwellia sp. 6M3]